MLQMSKTPPENQSNGFNRGSIRAYVDKDEKKREEEVKRLVDQLAKERYLCDLHTHLMGMGNTKFWIDKIIYGSNPTDTLSDTNDFRILPSHKEFCNNPEIRKKLCPLIWKEHNNGGCFIDGEKTSRFFELLIKADFPRTCETEAFFVLLCDTIKDSSVTTVFKALINNDRFVQELNHYNLSFGNSRHDATVGTVNGIEPLNENGNFTYDVVLTLSDLGEALGVITPQMVKHDDLIQSKVEEKLGLHTYQRPDKPTLFRRWIVFNARKQKFQVVKGITVETLRELISVKNDHLKKVCALARAHIENAFSMYSPDGSDPKDIDFDKFHGAFTPEFYPRRFALKDSLYSQRLDILAALLVHVLRRYQECQPCVEYCELSVGLSDLCQPWVFDVLCSFPAHDPIVYEEEQLPDTSFRRMILDKNGYFPYLRDACLGDNEMPHKFTPNVTYKFLVGFKRHNVKADRLKNPFEAIHLLNNSPDVAIHYMLEEIMQSETKIKKEKQKKQQQPSQENNQVSIFSVTLYGASEMSITTANMSLSRRSHRKKKLPRRRHHRRRGISKDVFKITVTLVNSPSYSKQLVTCKRQLLRN